MNRAVKFLAVLGLGILASACGTTSGNPQIKFQLTGNSQTTAWINLYEILVPTAQAADISTVGICIDEIRTYTNVGDAEDAYVDLFDANAEVYLTEGFTNEITTVDAFTPGSYERIGVKLNNLCTVFTVTVFFSAGNTVRNQTEFFINFQNEDSSAFEITNGSLEIDLGGLPFIEALEAEDDLQAQEIDDILQGRNGTVEING